MSPLLKRGSDRAVRRFAGASSPEPRPGAAPPALDPRDLEIERLAVELERLIAARKQDAAEAARRADAARKEGRAQGLAEAQKQEAERLAALSAGIEAATEAFETRLEVLDGLAPALVRGALAKLFDSFDAWSGPVEAAIARQLRMLGGAAIVLVRVSAKDFPEPASLAALSERLALDRAKLVADPNLHEGASRIECRLGQLDLDIGDQWQRLSVLLEDMAR